jgi:hypothetical protein
MQSLEIHTLCPFVLASMTHVVPGLSPLHLEGQVLDFQRNPPAMYYPFLLI